VTEEAWSVPDAYLLTEGPHGRVAVPHLTLTFFASGVALDKADGESAWFCNWTDLREMSPVERSVLPDGREGVVILLTERGRRRQHRFVLPTRNTVATEASLRDRAATHGLHKRRPRPAVSRALTWSIALATAGALTVLLLSAAHVFRL